MQITIGEYTTRNGCRAVVDFKDLCSGIELLRGFVILPGGLTKVCAWWDLEGRVRFPRGHWHYKDSTLTFCDKDNRFPCLVYTDATYAILTSVPSPFDITEPKQMKEETKPVLVQTQRLIKLPNGTWLDPRTITLISAEKEVYSNASGMSHKDRVLVYVDRACIVLECQSLAEAQKLADELAEKVNSIK
jgi:hypothetical protein